MKSTREIITRAVILLCLSDRCSLEKAIIGGKSFQKSIRENQRLTILEWLNKHGYSDMMTPDERKFFESEIGRIGKETSLNFQKQYEGIKPCLWALGLVPDLADYNAMDFDDYHPVLQIAANHKLENIEKLVTPRSLGEVLLQQEISLLWHWRAVMYNNPMYLGKTVRDVISAVFTNRYDAVLLKIKQYDNEKNDFIVNNKPVGELNQEEYKVFKTIARWRHHAFEWIAGEDRWDEVVTKHLKCCKFFWAREVRSAPLQDISQPPL